MLLRSASSPILNSWINPASSAKETSPDHIAADFIPMSARSVSSHHGHLFSPLQYPSCTHANSSQLPSPSSSSRITPRISRAMSESDLSANPPPPLCSLPSSSKPKPPNFLATSTSQGRPLLLPAFTSLSPQEDKRESEEEEDAAAGVSSVSPLLQLASSCRPADLFRSDASTLIGNIDEVDDDDESCGSSNGRICGGGGGRRGKRGSAHDHDHHHGDSCHNKAAAAEDMDAYYHKMIQANPGNSLVLANYAKFLKEVRGGLAKAEEYCERAILANNSKINPSTDGVGDAGWVLALYADLIWERTKDAQRADTCFRRAVQAAPDDCYVMASYARFLWDADEDDHEQGTEQKEKQSDHDQPWPPPLFPQLAAAS